MKISTFINAHKILVIPVVVGLMWFYDNWSTEAYVYLALHGTYGMLWLAKHRLYPDRRFEEIQPWWIGLLFVFLPLAGYYAAPFLLISRHVTLPPPLFAAVVSCYTVGIFLHYVSDAQKFFTLRVRKGLITEGLFARTRNPNYLGEILIYTAYAAMALHWLPFLILAGWVGGFFLRNMWAKDRSLARYPEFASYQQATGMLLPKLSGKRMAPGAVSG
jgi:protein-S-isoprenylcysteine O-methyltransferase Ste14